MTIHISEFLEKQTHTSTKPETGPRTTASSSPFSLHSDVNIPFIFRPQRLNRFHDVAALLSLICFGCPLHHSISIRAVLAHGCELGCVIWFRAEREHLFYKALAPSIPQASWKNQGQWWGRCSSMGPPNLQFTNSSPNPPKNNLSTERRRVTGPLKCKVQMCEVTLDLWLD